MHRRLPWWILVTWGAFVAAMVPLLLWGLVAGFQYANDWSSVVTASSAAVSGDLVKIGRAHV